MAQSGWFLLPPATPTPAVDNCDRRLVTNVPPGQIRVWVTQRGCRQAAPKDIHRCNVRLPNWSWVDELNEPRLLAFGSRAASGFKVAGGIRELGNRIGIHLGDRSLLGIGATRQDLVSGHLCKQPQLFQASARLARSPDDINVAPFFNRFLHRIFDREGSRDP